MTTLSESTGSLTADKILQGVIGILEQVFPDRVRGYFVRGSYASATSTQGSDLDMFVVFKDAFVESAEARRPVTSAATARCSALSCWRSSW
jgi:adenylate cyclase